jgi:hypothetical protein
MPNILLIHSLARFHSFNCQSVNLWYDIIKEQTQSLLPFSKLDMSQGWQAPIAGGGI